jgi:MMP 1-O-methyltransferase
MKLSSLHRNWLQPTKHIIMSINEIFLIVLYNMRYGALGRYIVYSKSIPGWTRGDEAVELAQVCKRLPKEAVVVEIGSFLGCSAILLAGARKLSGSIKVHCVDPFDGSGEQYSASFYREIAKQYPISLRHIFDQNILHANLTDWVEVHEDTAEAVTAKWTLPIDMIFFDGDQSPVGVRTAYELWAPFLKTGGVIALHNSADRVYDEGHDGHRRLVVESVFPPQYTDIYCVGTTTFATKAT